MRHLIKPALAALLLLTFAAGNLEADESQSEFELARFTPSIPAGELFPGADGYGDLLGTPPVIEIHSGRELIGYGFLNSDFMDSTGYSGKPIHQLVALDDSECFQELDLPRAQNILQRNGVVRVL